MRSTSSAWRSTDPANGSTVTVTPAGITVTFNKPVDLLDGHAAATSSSSATPAGRHASILGTPQAIDDPKFPTKVALPVHLQLHQPADDHGQRHLYVHRRPGSIVSKDGKPLGPASPITFTLNDTTAPGVASTTTFSRGW